MGRTQTASDQLVERLIEWGIDVVFGLPGDGINGVMEALRTHQDRIRFVHVRHEETAALAACAYGKLTGRPAACLSTAAPGAVRSGSRGSTRGARDHSPVGDTDQHSSG
jgi:pyruvate dehydrogenase (quinone)